ncbi:MAG: gliding motility-associated C-terminal domain-containing protein [Flavobacteriales bacterium]
MGKLKNIVLLLLLFPSLMLYAQINCSVNIVPDTLEICSGKSVTLQALGTKYAMSWSPKTNLSDSTSASPVASPTSTTEYHVLNRYLYPVESIVNGNFEQGDMGFTSQYGVDCSPGSLEQGNYCVNNVTNIYWPGWDACSDHTGGSGNMMIMDAATVAGVKVWCQTVPVNPNTDYQFTTWITSVLDENPALLQFSINNQLLGDPFRASENTCQWYQFYELWNSGVATSAEICVVNQNTEGQGNDFAMDDISFKSVCFSEDSVVVVVHPSISVDLGADKNICPGDSNLLKTDLPSNYQFSWSNGATTASTYVTNAGTYTVNVDNGFGCTDNDTIKLSPLGIPVSTLESDTTLCFAFVSSYDLHAGNALNYTWSTGEKTDMISIHGEGTYNLTLSNGKNCSVSDSVNIKDYCYPTFFYLPNAFSPNGDGINDVFAVQGESIYIMRLSIFNRWGELVFETTDPSKGWDGNGAPIGVYVVYYEYEGLSPNTDKKQKVQQFTHLNLIR